VHVVILNKRKYKPGNQTPTGKGLE
jgi:hypothetical protein